jgi:hypothetical protein
VVEGDVAGAAAYLVEQMTNAAQATVPLGQVLVVSNDVSGEVGYILVMAMDDTRPSDDPDALAATAAARLERLGWSTVTKAEDDYRDVRAHHPDHPGYGITVLCKANNPVTQWNGHTPSLPG